MPSPRPHQLAEEESPSASQDQCTTPRDLQETVLQHLHLVLPHLLERELDHHEQENPLEQEEPAKDARSEAKAAKELLLTQQGCRQDLLTH